MVTVHLCGAISTETNNENWLRRQRCLTTLGALVVGFVESCLHYLSEPLMAASVYLDTFIIGCVISVALWHIPGAYLENLLFVWRSKRGR